MVQYKQSSKECDADGERGDAGIRGAIYVCAVEGTGGSLGSGRETMVGIGELSDMIVVKQEGVG